MKRFGRLALAGLGVAVAAYFLRDEILTGLPRGSSDKSETAVHVVAVRRASVPLLIRLEGELSYARETDIVARVAGKVREFRAKVGDRVVAGAVVAVMDRAGLGFGTREIEAALDAARREAQASEQRAAHAERELERRREWHRRGLISRRDLDVAETEAQAAQAQVELARANLAQHETMLAQARALESLTRVTAPFAGVITHQRVEPGAVVRELDAVLTLADPRYLKFTSNYDSSYSEKVRSSTTVEVSIAQTPGGKYRGRITRVEAGAQGNGEQITIELENQREQLRPGMAVHGSIELDQRRGTLLVPRSAVILLGGKPHVYKAAGGRAKLQEVSLGEALDQEVELRQGAEAGEWVIIGNLEALKANGPVRLATAPLSLQSR